MLVIRAGSPSVLQRRLRRGPPRTLPAHAVHPVCMSGTSISRDSCAVTPVAH